MPDDGIPAEQWRPVVGWEGRYEVSDLGRVRSLGRAVRMPRGGTRNDPPIPIAAALNGRYATVSLAEDGKRSPHHVHRMVLEAFYGPRPHGMCCRHLDGDSHNNRLPNLAWGTYAENQSDKGLHGTMVRGERVAGSKLTEADVREIRSNHAAGISGRAMARKFGVTHRTISLIVRRLNWAHVE